MIQILKLNRSGFGELTIFDEGICYEPNNTWFKKNWITTPPS